MVDTKLWGIIHPVTLEMYCLRRAVAEDSGYLRGECRAVEVARRLPAGTVRAIPIPTSVWDIGAFCDQINPKLPVVYDVKIRGEVAFDSENRRVQKLEHRLYSTYDAARRIAMENGTLEMMATCRVYRE